MLNSDITDKLQVSTKETKETKKIDYNIEAIRGFAALFVAVGHAIILQGILDPSFQYEGVSPVFLPSHVAVLIFFVLSGYVIGISNKKPVQVWPYLKKRLVRLYPIYLFSILFSLLVANQVYPLETIIGHLTFLKIDYNTFIEENHPLWSLHYEVLFYLLFIPASYFSPLVVGLLAIIIGFINLYFPQIPILSSYAFGFVFWIAGWGIAKLKGKPETNYALLLSNIILVLAISSFNILSNGFGKVLTLLKMPMGLPGDFFATIISIHDFAFLPYAVMFILIASGKRFRYRKVIFTILQLLPVDFPLLEPRECIKFTFN